MITVSDATTSILGGKSYILHVRVESWLGGTLLDDDIPIAAGSEEVDRSLRVPERVTLTVPRVANGVSYAPTATDSPLAANGQRLRIQLGVEGRSGEIEWIQRGWFLLQDNKIDGDQVIVTAVGLLALIDEAQLISPYQPTGQIGASIRDLLEPALTVDLTNAPTDRSMPTTVNFDDDRLSGVLEMLDAWPAAGVVDEHGVFVVTSATEPTTVQVALTDSVQVVRAAGSSTRDGGFNIVVARGTASDGGQVQGVALLTTGPKAYGGNFNPLPVPYYFSSPLMTTQAQAAAGAQTVLTRLTRNSAQLYEIEAVPDPRLQAGDVASLDASGYTLAAASIERIVLPYTPDSGPMKLTVRSLA